MKRCNACKSVIDFNSAICPSCGKDPDKSYKAESNNSSYNGSIFAISTIVSFIIVALVVMLLTNIHHKPFAKDINAQKGTAKYECQEAVKEKLYSSKVDFEYLDYAMILPLGNMKFGMTGEFETVNMLGVPIREKYNCTVNLQHYNPEESLTASKIEELEITQL